MCSGTILQFRPEEEVPSLLWGISKVLRTWDPNPCIPVCLLEERVSNPCFKERGAVMSLIKTHGTQ